MYKYVRSYEYMPYCPICDIKFKTKSGLQGHFRFKHKIEKNSGRPATESAMTKAIGKNIDRVRSGDALMRELEKRGEEDRRVIFRGFEGEKKNGREKEKGKGFVFRNR